MPTVVDDVQLWCIERGQVYEQHSLIMVGESRIQLGIDSQVIRDRLPHHNVVQLALDGRNPIATLIDLCEDPKVDGTVLCSLNTQMIMNRQSWQAQREYVQRFRDGLSVNTWMNRQMATFVQARCSFRNPQVSLKRILASVARDGKLPRPAYVTTRSDRSRVADYSLTDTRKLTPDWVTNGISPDTSQIDVSEVRAFVQAVETLRPAVEALKRRGGQVVFIRMPTSAERFRIEEQRWPRVQFWNQIAELTGAAAVHFGDHAALAAFDCPDSSHLDGADAPAFTEALIATMHQNGLLSPLDTDVVASSNTAIPRGQ